MENLEAQIIRRILEGDVNRFGYFVDIYAPKIFSLISRIVPVREDAEELTQDALMKALRALTEFNMGSSFATWIYRIAYNVALSHCRRASRREVAVDEAQLRAVSDESVDALLDSSEDARIKCLPEALDMLSPTELALVTLYYYEGIPLKEVATVMDMSESNVKVRLMRTRKKLYVLIEKIYKEYE